MNIIHIVVSTQMIEKMLTQGSIPEVVHINPLPKDAMLIKVEHTPIDNNIHLFFKTDTGEGKFIPEGDMKNIPVTKLEFERR